MLSLIWHYGLSSVWKSLGWVSRGFCLVLLMTSIYSLASAARVLIRLRSLHRLGPAQHLALTEPSLAGVRDVIANVRQVIDATFYLFGFVLFWNLQTIGDFADTTKSSLGFYIFQNFIFHCFLGASAFFVFLLLHLSQWFVTGRVNTCARRLKGE